jgi:hypothetical protein
MKIYGVEPNLTVFGNLPAWGLVCNEKPPFREVKKTQMMKKNYFEVQRYSEEIYFVMSIINILSLFPLNGCGWFA